jgi:predicted ester cyclase
MADGKNTPMEDGKRIVTRYLEEIVNHGRFEVADEILADDFVNHTAGGGVGSGRKGFVDSLRALRIAFPDWTVSITAMIAEGDLVSDHLSVRATHTGQAAGMAPTGEKLSGELMHLWRLSKGRLAEGWYFGTPELMGKVFAALSKRD